MDYCLLLFASSSTLLSIFYYEADNDGKTKIADLCLYLLIMLTIIQSTIQLTKLRLQFLGIKVSFSSKKVKESFTKKKDCIVLENSMIS
jgi:CRISPR/Cas system-associated endonuclease/helicase Cas3